MEARTSNEVRESNDITKTWIRVALIERWGNVRLEAGNFEVASGMGFGLSGSGVDMVCQNMGCDDN